MILYARVYVCEYTCKCTYRARDLVTARKKKKFKDVNYKSLRSIGPVNTLINTHNSFKKISVDVHKMTSKLKMQRSDKSTTSNKNTYLPESQQPEM